MSAEPAYIPLRPLIDPQMVREQMRLGFDTKAIAEHFNRVTLLRGLNRKMVDESDIWNALARADRQPRGAA